MSRKANAALPRVGAGSVAWALLATCLLVACLLVAGAARAAADDTVAFTIEDSRVTASSGLAADSNAHVYWTVNDSGDSASAFALDETGRVVGTTSFRADVTDVEAVAYADNVLYVADIGDHNADRNHVTVYLLYNPQPNNGTVLYHAYDFAYPDGPHDAETLLVSPDGQLYLVTKGSNGGIYRAPAQPSRSQVNPLTRVAPAPPFVTDGQFLADGRIAVRSYVDVSILDPHQGYKVVARAATPYQPQGESLTQSLDGSSLLVGSKGKRSTVYSMPIPTAMNPAPTPGASPPPSPGRTGSPAGRSRGADPGGQTEADQDTNVDQNTAPGRGGTTEALLVAAAVAVAAGLGVYFARGRVRR